MPLLYNFQTFWSSYLAGKYDRQPLHFYTTDLIGITWLSSGTRSFLKFSRVSKVKINVAFGQEVTFSISAIYYLFETKRLWFVETFSTSWLCYIRKILHWYSFTQTERFHVYLQQFENETIFQKFAWYPGIKLSSLGSDFIKLLKFLTNASFI